MTKITLTLEPNYDNAFSNELVTAIFSGDENGKPARLTISSDRIWNLRLSRINR